MNFDYTEPRCRAICVAFAAALVLSLAACGDKPSADTAAKTENAAESAARQAEQAAANRCRNITLFSPGSHGVKLSRPLHS